MKHITKWWIIFGLIVTLIVGLFLLKNETEILSNEFSGTYASGNGPSIIYFSVSLSSNNQFLYADQAKEIYIKGKVISVADNIYKIDCDSLKAKEIIGVQEIKYKDKSFSLEILGETNIFKKIDDMPMVFGSEEEYY